MEPFSWRCPFCGRDTTITDQKCISTCLEFDKGNKYGTQYIIVTVIVCPNPECREYSVNVSLHDETLNFGRLIPDKAKKTWRIIPESDVKIFPDYIPSPIIQDYKEACLIKELSPKASATLSRRCLQGIIRDFWGIKRSRLIDEIEAIKDRVDPLTWAAIDAVRTIGNIGAHMEKDINLVIDVDPEEANLLVGLIETLITEWYIGRFERQRRMGKIIDFSKEKKGIKHIDNEEK